MSIYDLAENIMKEASEVDEALIALKETFKK